MKRLLWMMILVLFAAAAQAQTTKKPTNKKKPQSAKAPVKKTATAPKPAAKTSVAAKPAVKPAAPAASVNSPILYQKWVNSYEEEKGDGVMVYRPDGYAFPPSRGRRAIRFQKEGTLVRFDIGPADGEKILMGRWERTKFGNTMKVIVGGAESSVYFLEVLSVGPDLLRLRRKSEI